MMIEVKNLTKRYGNNRGVNGISFSIDKGEVVGFLGPNGAGKSTTLNMLTGFLTPSSGQIFIDGIDMSKDPIGAKRKIGYLPELPPLYLDMTVDEQLQFACDLKGIKQDQDAHIEKVCQLAQVAHMRQRIIKNLSKGYRQRVGVAQALIGDPEVLILDEPTVGLDPQQIIEMRNLIVNLQKHHTIILSSHILTEISAVVSRVLVLNEGNLVANDRPERLAKSWEGQGFVLEIEGPVAQVQAALEPLCLKVSYDHDLYTVTLDGGKEVRRQIFNTMAEHQWPILLCKPVERTLEEVFLELTHAQPQAEQGGS